MLEVVTAKVLDILRNWGLGKIQEWLTLDDRGVRFCLRLNLISAKPKPDFDSIYAYALVEYGDGKSYPILKFFRNKLIKEVFQKGSERGDFSIFFEEAESSQQWLEFAPQLRRIRFDYRKESNEFIRVFERLTLQTYTPAEIKQDQQLEGIAQKQDLGINKIDELSKLIRDSKKIILDPEWFKAKFQKQISGIKDKYNTYLHTPTEVDGSVHALLGDNAQVSHLKQLLLEILESHKELSKSIQFLSNQSSSQIIWEGTRDGLIEIAKNIEGLTKKLFSELKNVLSDLEISKFESAQNSQWGNVLDEISAVLDTYSSTAGQIDISSLAFQRDVGNTKEQKRIQNEAKEQIFAPLWQGEGFIAKARQMIDDLNCLKQTRLHILGVAGVGKTHLASHICSERISHGLPAILLLGRQFTSDAPVEQQLRQILDIPPAYSWKEFLQALSNVASERRIRIPIVIDGLNEATFHGAFSNIWRMGLAGLIQEISNTKNVVLITTCRATYKDSIWPDEPKESFVFASGFNDISVEDAVKKYFAWYKIKSDITTVSLSQFENPIYLQIFCASKNPTRQEEVYARIGQDSIFSVYDEYLKQINRVVCEHLHLHPKTSLIIPVLTKLGEYLWSNHLRNIPLYTAVEIIDGLPFERLNWDNSRTRAMEDEGLLVYRDWDDNQEKLYFTHDVLAGYMIAHYIIDQVNRGSGDYLNSDEVISRLFVDDQKQLHPLHEDICRCLAALLPIRIGRYLHELVDTPKSFDTSIRTLFEIQPEAINENAIEFIEKLFEEQENRFFLFDFLPSTLGYIGHPFCATFWSQLLTPLTLAERDISWTEYIRENEEIFEKIINHLEDACKGQDVISELIATHLNLYAEGVMWILTSTVRPLRDKATRALYWFGRRFPEQLLNLTSLSFTINDPYISERMLAAIYGVAMARQNDLVDKSFSEKILPIFGRVLFDAIFRIEAPFGTTHVLARDYALCTIQIAILHHHNLLTEEEKQRIVPPFMDGGIREWGQSKVDGELYEPIRMDFGNYTVGKLVRHRSNYDFKNDEYKAVLSNLYWRISDLGYQEKLFKEIDQRISLQNSGRHDDGSKTDRYGKKYSWIAFFELAGFRQDITPLTEVGEETRLSDADLDPSFPGEIPLFELIKNDFSGDRKMSSEDWVINGDKPDLLSYCTVDDLMGESGKWVLLDGYLSQEDSDTQRKLFIFPRGFLVDKEITNELVNKATNQDLSNRRLPEIPEDYYTYAGEIPWADTYPYNGSEVLELVVDDHEEIQIEEKLDISRNGVPLSKDENLDFWSQVVSLSNKNNEDQLDNAVEKIAADMGLEIDTSIEQTTIRVSQNEEFELQIPIRKNSWESHHSVTNPGQGASTLSKEICEHLHLCSQPRTYDLFDESGLRASISFRFGEGMHTYQNFIYMRKDLLDKYILETGKDLLWIIWGEKSVTNKDINPGYQVFQQISRYPRTQ